MSQNPRPPEAFRSADLFDQGLGYVVISRFKSDGRVEMGVFLVDIFCLGVKDAFFYRAETLSAYERTLEEIMRGERVAMPPAAARKLVEQAVAYAAKLGFELQEGSPDFRRDPCRGLAWEFHLREKGKTILHQWAK